LVTIGDVASHLESVKAKPKVLSIVHLGPDLPPTIIPIVKRIALVITSIVFIEVSLKVKSRLLTILLCNKMGQATIISAIGDQCPSERARKGFRLGT